MAKTEAATAGVGFPGLLALVFITLKLLGKINWAWKWVLAPIWLPIVLGILVITLALAMYVATGQSRKH